MKITVSTQYNQLLIQLQQYKNFMPYCPDYKVVDLSHEIIKISKRLEYISTLNDLQKRELVHIHFETKQSKLNELNF